MAIDQTNIALDIASRGVQLAGTLQQTLEELEDLLAWGVAAGLDLSEYDAAFAESPELQHVDGQTLNRLFGAVAPGVINFLDTTEVNGGDSYTDIVQKARRS